MGAWFHERGRRILIGTVGGVVVVAGAVLFVTPIPVGIILVPLGFLILALEFRGARAWLRWVQRRTGKFGRAVRTAERPARRWLARRGLAALGRRPVPSAVDPASRGLEPGQQVTDPSAEDRVHDVRREVGERS